PGADDRAVEPTGGNRRRTKVSSHGADLMDCSTAPEVAIRPDDRIAADSSHQVPIRDRHVAAVAAESGVRGGALLVGEDQLRPIGSHDCLNGTGLERIAAE